MSTTGKRQLHPLAPAHPGHGTDLHCPLLILGLKMGPVCCHMLLALFPEASNRRSPVVLSTPGILLSPETPEHCAHQNPTVQVQSRGRVLQQSIKMQKILQGTDENRGVGKRK